MPARWQSSQRPLFVRTVWVDGRRHAILTRDDPLLQYPRSSSSSASDTCSQTSSCCHLENCLVKLRLALQPQAYQGTFQESIFPISQGTVESSPCYDHEDCESLSEEDLPQLRLPLLGQYPKVYSLDRGEPPYLPELQLNPLSERVLQWLDLNGKGKRLNTANPAAQALSGERRKHSAVEARKTHTSRRRELPTRSLSVDMRLSARSMDTFVKHKPHAVVVALSRPDPQECQVKKPAEEPPVVQNFEPPRLLRPVGSPHSPNRPQLHIFMPPLDDGGRPGDSSECESTLG